MTCEKKLLSNFQNIDGPRVLFGDNNCGQTRGIGTLVIGDIQVSEVYFVEGLKHNLLSVSQLCDKGFHVRFSKDKCDILDNSADKVLLSGFRHGNVYVANFNSCPRNTCLVAKSGEDLSWLWHKRLSHLNFKTLNKIAKKKLVKGLPEKLCSSDLKCDACQKGKQPRNSFKSINTI